MIEFSRILVIRLSSIGDIVLASPLLRVLRTNFPNSQIDFFIKKEFAELIRYNPNINTIYEFNSSDGWKGLRALKKKIKAEHYDLVIDIHNLLRSNYLRSNIGAKHILTINKRILKRTALVKFKWNIYDYGIPIPERYIEPLKPFSIINDNKGLELFFPDEVRLNVSDRVAKEQLQAYGYTIGICPSAKHFTKRWQLERFSELGILLAKNLKSKIFVFGGYTDKDLGAAISSQINSTAGNKTAMNFCGEFSILETASAMELCDLIVTNDSGLLHIASAMKRKIVAIFGSTVREFGFFPYMSDAVVLELKDLRCRPCSHIGRNRCPKGHFKCMKDISVEMVYKEINKKLADLKLN